MLFVLTGWSTWCLMLLICRRGLMTRLDDFDVSKVRSHIVRERNPFEAASTPGLHAKFQGSQELVRVQLAKIGAFQDVLYHPPFKSP